MQSDLLQKYPRAVPVLFLILMIVLPYWKLTTMQGFIITDDIFTSDIMNEGFPYRYYIGEALKNGELPLWLPSIYGGIPLLARAEAGVCYPFNLVLFGILSPYVALNLVILVTLLVAALTMYYYARELEASEIGAIVAALAFAYSGFMVSHIKHLSMVGTVCWFPLGLFVIERGVRGENPRALLWIAAVFGLQNLSGHIQTAYYAGLIYLIYFISRFAHKRAAAKAPRRHRKPNTGSSPASLKPYAVWFLLGMTLGVGISAVQILPTYELVSLTQRSGGVSFDYAANYAYDPANFKTFFYPYVNGDIGNATYTGKSVFWEDYGYVGLATLLLAAYAALRRWKRWHVRLFVIISIMAFLLVLGPNTPVYKAVFYAVPGMKFFRFPTRFLFVVDASLAVLAALGATEFIRSIRESRRPLYSLLFVVIVGTDLLFFQMRQNPVVDAARWLEKPRTAQILQRDKSLFRIYSPGASEMHKAAFSKAKGWEGDLEPFIEQREFLQVSGNVVYDIASADGYAQLTPGYVVNIWGDQNRSGMILKTASLQREGFIPRQSFMNLMNLFNVKYILSPWPFVSDGVELMEKADNVFLYRNPTVFPRSFVVHDFHVATSEAAAQTYLISEKFKPSQEAILYENPDLGHSQRDADSSSVHIEHYSTNEVIVDVETPSPGLLVLSDTYYPGWVATVDNLETQIYKANLCQRAIVIPGGKHEVRFQFVSSSVRAGFTTSIVSLIALLAVWVIVRKGV